MAGRIYSNEFKIQAVKRVVEDGVSSAQVARELEKRIRDLENVQGKFFVRVHYVTFNLLARVNNK